MKPKHDLLECNHVCHSEKLYVQYIQNGAAEVFCSMPHWLSLNAILCILYLVMHKEWIAHLDEIHDSQILILPPMFHPNSVEINGSISKYWRNSVFCTFLRLPAKAIQQLQSCCIIAVSQKYPCDIPLCSLT